MQFFQNTQKVCARLWLFSILSSKKLLETLWSNGECQEMDLFHSKNWDSKNWDQFRLFLGAQAT